MRHAPVITLEPAAQWDHQIVRETLARCPGWTFSEHDHAPPGCDVAVVVVPGRYPEAPDRLRAAIADVPAAIVFVTGDEEAVFPHAEIDHPAVVWWQQLPRPREHEGMRLLPCGPAPHLRPLLRQLGDLPREHDWSFAGQVSNKRRRACAEVLRDLDGGVLVETPGFTQGLPHDEYARLLATSRVVACPSGPHTVDTFRWAEALEAGCVPVADTICGDFNSLGYWEWIAGGPVPFPMVEDWRSFPAVVAETVADWPAVANRCRSWWLRFKRRLAHNLAADLAAVA